MSLCILNPNPGYISTSTVNSLLDEFRYDFIERRSHVNINHTRNQLVYDFLTSNHDSALLLDSDIVFPPGTIQSLYNLISPTHKLISAVYGQPRKDISLITHPDGSPWLDYPTDQLIETGPTGVGFMMVHHDVFADILSSSSDEFPWFRETVEDHMWISEDIYFCRRAQQAGYKLYTDTSVICGHTKDGATYYPSPKFPNDI